MQKANEKMILNGVYFVYDVKKSGYNAFLSNGVCLVNVGFCGYIEKEHLSKFADFVKNQNKYKFYSVNE